MTLVVEKPAYRLEVSDDGREAWLFAADGERLISLRPAAALDTTAAPDETLATEPARLEGDTIVLGRRSTVWERAETRLVCGDDAIELRATVSGRGTLDTVHLLGYRSLAAAGPTGFQGSISNFRALWSPSPGDAAKVVRPAGETVGIGVSGDGALGRGHYFFTPAPLYLALSTDERMWVDLGICAPVEELTFAQLVYQGGDRLCSLRLDYEGHTEVDGDFAAPVLVLTPGVADPLAGLRRHRDDLVARGAAPPVAERERPAWWSEPIFCGWGAQVHLARERGEPWGAPATQASYDAFLAHLEQERLVPGTVVLDDKWQSTYGGNEPDEAKWPDLAGWIAARHARGQKVLLWWKAWDPEGVPAELCIRDPEGTPVGLDPTNPATCEFLRAMVTRLLGPDGLDGDGLKIDFTARTPTGRALTAHGSGWGVALLHRLLGVVYEAAKAAKPDALLITQTPNPAFVDVSDMVRLNDMLRMDDPGPPTVVEQMRYRAAVTQAACPELLVDTDDWQVPSREIWRNYLRVKGQLGVPALYYATHFDETGEPLEAQDYALLRDVWTEWRNR
jgi:hypothetical protein